MQALVWLSCLLAVASAWNCPDLPVVESLNVTQLAGTWYQQSILGVAIFTPPGGSCTTDIFTEDTPSESLFTFQNTQTILYEQVTVSGWANFANSSEQNGKLISTVPSLFFDTSDDLWVLDTDYENYLILYSCRDVLGLPVEAGWVLTRIQSPVGVAKIELDSLIYAAFVKIEEAGGPYKSNFAETDQSNC